MAGMKSRPFNAACLDAAEKICSASLQVSPLRFAPVEMTKWGEDGASVEVTTERVRQRFGRDDNGGPRDGDASATKARGADMASAPLVSFAVGLHRARVVELILVANRHARRRVQRLGGGELVGRGFELVDALDHVAAV